MERDYLIEQLKDNGYEVDPGVLFQQLIYQNEFNKSFNLQLLKKLIRIENQLNGVTQTPGEETAVICDLLDDIHEIAEEETLDTLAHITARSF